MALEHQGVGRPPHGAKVVANPPLGAQGGGFHRKGNELESGQSTYLRA
jgi:hypothetical protein